MNYFYSYPGIFSTSSIAGEICREWKTWSEYLHIQSIFGQSLLQSLVYVTMAVNKLYFEPTTNIEGDYRLSFLEVPLF